MPAYQERFYRDWVREAQLVGFEASVAETDLAVWASRDLKAEALQLIRKHRALLESYGQRESRFFESLEPIAVADDAPEIVALMAAAADQYSVGPMAAVAGAVAEMVGKGLLELSDEVIIENGGDLFIKTREPKKVGIYAGPESPFSGKLSVEVDTSAGAKGVCTSSGTVGHSLSFGKADAVITIASSAIVADAAATAIANRIQSADDVQPALDEEGERGLLLGVLIIIGQHLGAWGEVQLAT